MSQVTGDHGAIRFVIVTRDSARWIGPFLAAYRAIGLEPLYIVDARSADDTLTVLQDAGADVQIFAFEGNYIESGPIQFAAETLSTTCDWTFRIDDDEFPSLALLRWMQGPQKEAAAAWALSRREIIRDGDRLAYSRLWSHYHTVSRPDFLNAQVRLYRHREMSFVRTIHSSGFLDDRSGFAPQDAYFIHLDVLLRDLDERIAKIRRYERDVPGSSWRFGTQYLPEIVPREQNRPTELETNEFDPLFRSLPSRPDVEQVVLQTSELRALLAGPFDRDTFNEDQRIYGAAEIRRRRKGPASRRLGEFLCTVLRPAMQLTRGHGSLHRCMERLFDLGTDLQYRALARREARKGAAPRGGAAR